jgi:hypothetical protein
LIFDDAAADKNYARSTELLRRQGGGDTHAVIRGIGIVTCMEDGETKLDPAAEMFDAVVHHEQLEFRCTAQPNR